MKKKFSKMWGVGLTFVLAVSLMLVAAPTPVSAADDVILEWDEFTYPDPGEDGDWFRDADIRAVGPVAAAIDGTLYAYVDHGRGDNRLMKSDDNGRTWEETDYAEDLTGEGAIVDIACSSLDADILYVTDGNYVYKSDDAGDEFDFVAKDSLEKALQGVCGTAIVNQPITCLDVGYNADDEPIIFIGTKTVAGVVSLGSVFFIAEEGFPAEWTDLNLSCFRGGSYDAYSVGCTPDFADSKKTFVVVSCATAQRTFVLSTIGTTCSWSEFAELKQDCRNSFDIQLASEIGYPDDWEDTETLFVGVVDVDSVARPGGDVYSVSDGDCIDRNVEGTDAGCIGDEPSTNIIGLAVCGDTDDGAILAGAYDDTTVYYSTDGGWDWDDSGKDPTGDSKTFVLWLGDECGESALAATKGCECAVSLTCISDEVEDVGESWNQISLIDTDITCVKDLDHVLGYITASETLFMVTECADCCAGLGTSSLFRYDGTYWERVFCSTTEDDVQIEMVLVSPDFSDTSAVFVGNTGFDMFRSVDAGCEWDMLAYPCEPKPTIASWAVLDEDTVYAGGAGAYDGIVYKTERHGSRPWDECEITGAGDIRYFGFAGDYIMASDDESQVFFCEFDPDEDWEDQDFDEVGDCQDVLGGTNPTSVVFDPGFTVSGDEGENTIYAAAGNTIARCVIDWDEDWEDQEWTDMYSYGSCAFWGMKVAGDTALYVGDTYYRGLLRTLNPLEEDEDDIEWEWVQNELDADTRGLRTRTAGENGCPASNVLWAIGSGTYCDEVWFYEDTLATPVILTTPADEANLDVTKIAEVTLMWEAFCEAEYYEIELYKYCAECPDHKIKVTGFPKCIECEDVELDCVGCSDENCCYVVDEPTLEPGTTYYWKVRVCEDEPTLSKFSELWTFTTAMPVVPYLCSPECGERNVIITPNFSWTGVENADYYEVQIATNEDFTDAVSGTATVNAWVGAPELEYNTVYYWKVRAVKDGVYSDWSVCIFTTMEEPVEEWISPYTGEKFYSEADLLAHIAAWDAAHAPTTPLYIWVIIAIGAVLVIALLVLIVRTRRVA